MKLQTFIDIQNLFLKTLDEVPLPDGMYGEISNWVGTVHNHVYCAQKRLAGGKLLIREDGVVEFFPDDSRQFKGECLISLGAYMRALQEAVQ